MHDGQMLMQGRPDEVVVHKDVRRFYLGEKIQPLMLPDVNDLFVSTA